MIILRNILFYIIFAIDTSVFFVLFIIGLILPARYRHYIGVGWARSFVILLKYIIGLDYRVEGAENIPKEPSIICSKHQSGYETLVLQMIFPHQVYVMKRELFYVPVLGQGLMLMSPIAINRKDKANATKQILEQGALRKAKGFWITIFPEGTRTKPGLIGQYKLGGARMASALHMNLVPVAMNSGEFWPRNSVLKYPGTVTFVIGKAVKWDSGTPQELMHQCEEIIESNQRRIEGSGPCFPKNITQKQADTPS